jgi:hypothetical protein
MECCSTAASAISRKAFLEQKLKNFRVFLEPLCITDAQKARLAEYNDVNSVMPFLLQALALRTAGTLTTAINSFVAEFTPPDAKAFRTKVERYVNMFCDVLTS